jgi:hypothetical protein
MASIYREYKLSYDATEESLIVDMANVTRNKNETTVIRITPSGAKWKQVFGSGKVSWTFSFSDNTDRTIADFFQDAYDASVDGSTITLSEENDSGGYDEYEVIINQPVASPDTVGSDATDRGLTVEVFET